MKEIGIVQHGLGDGAVYMHKYARYFADRLGMDFYLGTLNVKIDKPLARLPDPILIIPEETDLYPVACYPIKINDTPAFLVVPQITEHPNTILEIIAEENLRETLKLNDGDVVEIEL